MKDLNQEIVDLERKIVETTLGPYGGKTRGIKRIESLNRRIKDRLAKIERAGILNKHPILKLDYLKVRSLVIMSKNIKRHSKYNDRLILNNQDRNETLIDSNDHEYLSQYSWNCIPGNWKNHSKGLHSNYYAVNNQHYQDAKGKNKVKQIYLHRVIWELHHGPLEQGMVIDHIDRNGLNNKIENLRAVTQTENCNNMRNNIRIIYKGEKMTLRQAANLSGFKYGTLQRRYSVNKEVGLFRELEYKAYETII